MITTELQRKEFEEAARPMVKWLNDNCHPHVTAVIDPGSATLSEGCLHIPIEDYIKD